jgi:hypothetical protein
MGRTVAGRQACGYHAAGVRGRAGACRGPNDASVKPGGSEGLVPGRHVIDLNGAGAQNRTVDLLITNQLLYP